MAEWVSVLPAEEGKRLADAIEENKQKLVCVDELFTKMQHLEQLNLSDRLQNIEKAANDAKYMAETNAANVSETTARVDALARRVRSMEDTHTQLHSLMDQQVSAQKMQATSTANRHKESQPQATSSEAVASALSQLGGHATADASQDATNALVTQYKHEGEHMDSSKSSTHSFAPSPAVHKETEYHSPPERCRNNVKQVEAAGGEDENVNKDYHLEKYNAAALHLQGDVKHLPSENGNSDADGVEWKPVGSQHSNLQDMNDIDAPNQSETSSATRENPSTHKQNQQSVPLQSVDERSDYNSSSSEHTAGTSAGLFGSNSQADTPINEQAEAAAAAYRWQHRASQRIAAHDVQSQSQVSNAEIRSADKASDVPASVQQVQTRHQDLKKEDAYEELLLEFESRLTNVEEILGVQGSVSSAQTTTLNAQLSMLNNRLEELEQVVDHKDAHGKENALKNQAKPQPIHKPTATDTRLAQLESVIDATDQRVSELASQSAMQEQRTALESLENRVEELELGQQQMWQYQQGEGGFTNRSDLPSLNNEMNTENNDVDVIEAYTSKASTSPQQNVYKPVSVHQGLPEQTDHVASLRSSPSYVTDINEDCTQRTDVATLHNHLPYHSNEEYASGDVQSRLQVIESALLSCASQKQVEQLALRIQHVSKQANHAAAQATSPGSASKEKKDSGVCEWDEAPSGSARDTFRLFQTQLRRKANRAEVQEAIKMAERACKDVEYARGRWVSRNTHAALDARVRDCESNNKRMVSKLREMQRFGTQIENALTREVNKLYNELHRKSTELMQTQDQQLSVAAEHARKAAHEATCNAVKQWNLSSQEEAQRYANEVLHTVRNEAATHEAQLQRHEWDLRELAFALQLALAPSKDHDISDDPPATSVKAVSKLRRNGAAAARLEQIDAAMRAMQERINSLEQSSNSQTDALSVSPNASERATSRKAQLEQVNMRLRRAQASRGKQKPALPSSDTERPHSVIGTPLPHIGG